MEMRKLLSSEELRTRYSSGSDQPCTTLLDGRPFQHSFQGLFQFGCRYRLT